ncbi:MAG: ribbon-helix-helix protein, CopG family [Rhodobacteraceae bacterium]|nr:ribbon-helix-helix protein, CopG family [Paracoccaceae bacterium]
MQPWFCKIDFDFAIEDDILPFDWVAMSKLYVWTSSVLWLSSTATWCDKERVFITLEEAQVAQLDTIARKRRKRRSTLIQAAIDLWLEHQEPNRQNADRSDRRENHV